MIFEKKGTDGKTKFKVVVSDKALFRYLETIRKAWNDHNHDAFLYERQRAYDHEELLKHLKGRISFNYKENLYGLKSREAMQMIMDWIDKEIGIGDREQYGS